MSLYQETLPEFFKRAAPDELHALVDAARSKLGDSCLILGHHYQREEVIVHSDITGDSLKLAHAAHAATRAKSIVFCGVHFMAETADMLTTAEQHVSLPDYRAGCDMADMSPIQAVQRAWRELAEHGLAEDVTPISYVNSSAAVKAFVGRHDGAICTSGNAKQIVTWALAQKGHIFFFPDQHLGRNIAKQLGLSPETDMVLWDPAKALGGHSPDALRSAAVWLWKGHCPVHALFTIEQIAALRRSCPETVILVHPECAMEVVDAADLVGSTEFIIQTVAAAPAGTAFAVGTEQHLVQRLAARFPDKFVQSLNRFLCPCGTMSRIDLPHLAWVMDDLVKTGTLRNPVTVSEDTRALARRALDRMLAIV